MDGAEAATYGFYEQKHFEVANHLSLTSHVYTPSFLLASNAFFDSLTPEQQQVFVETGNSITDATYEISAELETKYLAEMRGLLEVNDVDLPAFQAATASSYDDYVAKHGDAFLTIIRGAAE